MAYIGNNLTVQQYTPQVAYFNGNASQTAFTLPVPVVSAAQIIVTVENVIQNPSSGFSVSGSTLTFTSAPPSGTNNIWVEYTSLKTTVSVPPFGYSEFATGTTLLFQQTTAPNGWTKQTTHNDKALRVVSGTASTGGSVGFTTAFASQAVNGTVGTSNLVIALSVAEAILAIAPTSAAVKTTVPVYPFTLVTASVLSIFCHIEPL